MHCCPPLPAQPRRPPSSGRPSRSPATSSRAPPDHYLGSLLSIQRCQPSVPSSPCSATPPFSPQSCLCWWQWWHATVDDCCPQAGGWKGGCAGLSLWQGRAQSRTSSLARTPESEFQNKKVARPTPSSFYCLVAKDPAAPFRSPPSGSTSSTPTCSGSRWQPGWLRTLWSVSLWPVGLSNSSEFGCIPLLPEAPRSHSRCSSYLPWWRRCQQGRCRQRMEHCFFQEPLQSLLHEPIPNDQAQPLGPLPQLSPHLSPLDSIAVSVFVHFGWVYQILRRLPWPFWERLQNFQRPLDQWRDDWTECFFINLLSHISISSLQDMFLLHHGH